jgi:hypothetical protein
MIHFDLPKEQSSIIKVIGVGGGGSNAVNHMFSQKIDGVNFVICNTDAQAIALSQVPNKVHPSDRHVIAAALVLAETCGREGTAHDKIFVVSDNTKDLAPREVQKRGISVLSAGAFLDEIYTAASQRCIAAVNRSLSELKRPPYTRLEMIRSLRLHRATRLANGLRTAWRE